MTSDQVPAKEIQAHWLAEVEISLTHAFMHPLVDPDRAAREQHARILGARRTGRRRRHMNHWRRIPGREAYTLHRASQDRADTAQDVLQVALASKAR